MFFGNEKRNRKSCSEEKKVKGKTIYFYGLESGLSSTRRKLFKVARKFIGRRERFGRFFGGFSTIFLENFYNFLENFYNFLKNFCDFLENFPKIFCNFFRLLRFPYDFSENSRPQSVTVQPGSRHYCKFTTKFTSKFTPILIKILQSTKFEDSHFHNL